MSTGAQCRQRRMVEMRKLQGHNMINHAIRKRQKQKVAEDRESMKFTDDEKANILQKQFASGFTHDPAGGILILTSRTNSRIAEITVDMV